MTTAHITTPSGEGGLSNWTRQHADSPVINWTTRPGPGGTLLITEPDVQAGELEAVS